jgi:type IV pilus assembly protein PilE
MQRAEQLRQRPPRGFTLVEIVVALMLVALLVMLAYPSFRAQWLKARRGDGRVALMQLQQTQERWRADHPAYAAAADLNAPERSAHGHYRLGVHATSASGYELHAEAQGAQREDTVCKVLRVRQSQGETTFLSGPSLDVDNPDRINRECWNR